MSLTLRPYQNAAIQGIYNYFNDETGNPLIVIPTAGGKALVMASFIEGVLKVYRPIWRSAACRCRRCAKGPDRSIGLGIWCGQGILADRAPGADG